jgi:ankyrin repeat protein
MCEIRKIFPGLPGTIGYSLKERFVVHCNARFGSHQGRPTFHALRATVTTLLVLASLLGTQRTNIAQEKDQEKTDADKEQLNLAFRQAILKNDVPTVQARIKKGVDFNWFNTEYNRKTPLIIAMMYTQAKPQAKLDLVKLLLDSGADVHCPDGSHKYPMLYSVFSGDVEIVQLIIDRGGSQEINIYGSSNEQQPYGIGKTALTCVCTYYNITTEMIPILMKAGADPNQRSSNKMGLPVLISAIRNESSKNFDKVEAVKCLIEHGADVNLKGRPGGNPKEEEMSALGEAKKKGYQEIIEILEKAGAKE